MCLGCEFEVRSFDDCINGASFLAEATVNAFCHVDVVPVEGLGSLLHTKWWKRKRMVSGFEGKGISDLVVLRLPSSRSSASIVIA